MPPLHEQSRFSDFSLDDLFVLSAAEQATFLNFENEIIATDSSTQLIKDVYDLVKGNAPADPIKFDIQYSKLISSCDEAKQQFNKHINNILEIAKRAEAKR